MAPRTSTHAKEEPFGDEKVGEKKGNELTETHSISYEEGPAITPDPDLDPVELDKAFRFAAWSSVVLVCIFSYISRLPDADNMLSLPDACLAHSCPFPSLFRAHCFRCAWAHRVGRHRNPLVFLFRFHCRTVSVVGESCRSCSDITWNLEGAPVFRERDRSRVILTLYPRAGHLCKGKREACCARTSVRSVSKRYSLTVGYDTVSVYKNVGLDLWKMDDE